MPKDALTSQARHHSTKVDQMYQVVGALEVSNQQQPHAHCASTNALNPCVSRP